MKRRFGFTLIELLVVIAIIAILAAILFPVFARARKKARMTMCLSNMNQAGKGCMMYHQDYNETYHLGSNSTTRATNPNEVNRVNGYAYVDWTSIKPYIKNDLMLICPEDIGNRTSWNSGGIKYYKDSRTDGSSYGHDAWVYYSGCPAPRVTITGNWCLMKPGGGYGKSSIYMSSAQNILLNEIADYHAETTAQSGKGVAYNEVFMDGHAKNVPLSEYYCSRFRVQVEAGGKLDPGWRTFMTEGGCTDLDIAANY